MLLCLDDNGSHTKCNSGVESILKKDRGQTVSIDLQSSSSDRTRQRRKDDYAGGQSGDVQKSSGCGNSRRVLFKNNVSVYCFDAEPSAAQNSCPNRRTRDNVVRSNGPSHDAIMRPPTSSISHDLLVSRGYRRPSVSHSRVDGELNLPHRRTEKYVVNSTLPSSSTVVVHDFEVL